MDIVFRDQRLRALCEQQSIATRTLGATCARRLQARLADLQAAMCVADLVAGHPHPLQGDRLGQFALDLAGGRRLVFEPDHDPVPERESGGIDWTQVTRIRVIYVGDYHD
jgi:toxin HigB-1